MNAAGASPPGTRLGTSLASWVEHPGRVLVGCLVLFLALAPGLARLSLDNSPERFFVRDADALARYERFEFDFGRDRSVRLVFEGPGIWTREGLAWIAGIEESAAHVRGVLATAGPVAHHRWRLGDDLSADPAGFRAEVLADPLDHEAGWVSDDGTTVTVLVALYKLSSRDQEQVLEALEERVASPPPGIRAWVTGLPAVQRALDRALLEMAEIFFPILALLALLLLAAVFGGLRGAFRPLVLVLFCQGCVFGAMGWAGVAVDMVTVVLVPLLFVVTLATAIHLEVRFRAERRRAASAPAAARATLDAKLWAVVCTGGTTAVGFGSLVVAQLPSVRALGLWSLGGFLFMTAAAVTLYPALLARTREAPSSARQTAFDRLFSRWGGTWAAGAVAHRGRTLGLFALAGLVAAAGLPRLYLESSFLDYFHHDHPVRRGLDELTARGLGVISAELVL
ncbi:MAG: MMPL family transporter, partial [Acidobacteria bacterium]|nr:MMPL family transporter [Acidobacteriota bacterium]